MNLEPGLESGRKRRRLLMSEDVVKGLRSHGGIAPPQLDLHFHKRRLLGVQSGDVHENTIGVMPVRVVERLLEVHLELAQAPD